MNKKLAFSDIIIFLTGITFLIITRLLINLKIAVPENYIVSIIYMIILIGIEIFSMIISYKGNDNKVSVVNIILPLFLAFLLLLLYFLPVFNFIGCLGVNNSVCLCFVFLLGARYIYNIGLFIKGKSRNVMLHIPTNALNASKNTYKRSYRIFIYVAYIMIAICSIGVIVNTFLPKVDVSLPFADCLNQ